MRFLLVNVNNNSRSVAINIEKTRIDSGLRFFFLSCLILFEIVLKVIERLFSSRECAGICFLFVCFGASHEYFEKRTRQLFT